MALSSYSLEDRLHRLTAAAVPTPQQILSLGAARVVPAASLARTDVAALHASAALSTAVLLLYALRRPVLARLPRWLRPFAADEGPVPDRRKAWTHWTLVLAGVCLAGLVLAVVPACLGPRQPVAVLEPWPWLVAALITAFERPVKTPRILLLHYLLVLAVGLATCSLHFLHRSSRVLDPFRLGRLVAAAAGVVAIGLMPLRNPAWDTHEIGNATMPPSRHLRSPENNLSLFRFWAMTWVYPLARICRRRDITVDDFWQLPLEFQHRRLYVAFGELRGNLLPRLARANGLDLVVATALAFVDTVGEVSVIRLTAQLYRALDADGPREAVFWCLVMLGLDVLRQLCRTTSSWYSRKAYERSRGETFIALFGKLLTRAVSGSDVTDKGPDHPGTPQGPGRLHRLLRGGWCAGRKTTSAAGQPQQHRRDVSPPASNANVINLVRGDTYEISQRFWDLPRFVSQPIKVLVSIYFLVDVMGWPSLVSFGLMAVFLTVNSLLVGEAVSLERQRTAHLDRRAQAVAHFFEAIRPLKLNDWTASWSRRILAARAVEMAKRL